MSINIKIVRYISIIYFIIIFILLMSGNSEAILAWSIMFICLLPPLVIVQKNKFLSIKIIIWIIFLSQVISLPMFYLTPESYMFQAYRPFMFTGLESFKVYGRLSAIVYSLVILSNIIEKLLNIKSIQLIKENHSNQNLSLIKSKFINLFNLKKVTPFASIKIIFIIILIIPLNNWMFISGIGLTGVEPPRLPFHLSGILSYFVKFLIPIILSVLYIKSKRSSLTIILVLGLYSTFLGVSTVSKGAALLVILAPTIYSYIDRKWIYLVTSILFLSFSTGLASASREIVYLVSNNINFSNTGDGLLNTIFSTLFDFKWDQFYLLLPSIIGRIDSFENFWLASNVNPSTFGGGGAILTKIFDWRLIDLGHDAVHFEVLGHTVPEGFYNVSASFIDFTLWAVNGSSIYFFIFPLFAIAYLYIQEYLVYRLFNKYHLNSAITKTFIFAVVITFYINPGMPMNNFIFILLIAFFLIIYIGKYYFTQRFKKK